MSILSTLGLGTGKKVRYAIVALGDIAQEAMLPGIKHTRNSEVTAFVTGDPEKARKVGEQYGVHDTYGYDEFDRMLASGKVDAIYLATPNWRHAEFIIPALQAGIHVLVEKPLEISTEKSRQILDVARASSAKLMVAYRLHFEPATLATIARIRAGDLGQVIAFSSAFVQRVSPDNHRATSGDLAGPVLDMAPYPINAARYVFEAEPEEVVSAVGTRHPEAGFGDFDDTVAVTLRFPGGRLAQFVVSYFGHALDSYFVLGTEGSIHMQPGYTYGEPLEHVVSVGDKKTRTAFEATDQFGGELQYFSECILKDTQPEPDAEEGYADVRVVEGILRALKSGTAQVLPPFTRTRRIDLEQEKTLSVRKPPELVNAANPSAGME